MRASQNGGVFSQQIPRPNRIPITSKIGTFATQGQKRWFDRRLTKSQRKPIPIRFLQISLNRCRNTGWSLFPQLKSDSPRHPTQREKSTRVLYRNTNCKQKNLGNRRESLFWKYRPGSRLAQGWHWQPCRVVNTADYFAFFSLLPFFDKVRNPIRIFSSSWWICLQPFTA